ncbi:MAG: GGDEF domain-containing protein [Planctomycetota bacterium]|jgi:diguanylate cyclase (GGDEF)-like protein
MPLRRVVYACLALVAAGSFFLTWQLARAARSADKLADAAREAGGESLASHEKTKSILSSARILSAGSGVLSLVVLVALAHLSSRETARRRRLERDLDTETLRRTTDGDRARVLKSVNDLVEVLGETRDVDAVLNQAAASIRGILDVENIWLEISGSEESVFRSHIVLGTVEDISLGEELYDDVIGSGNSRLINRLDGPDRYGDLAEQGFSSLLVTPIVRSAPGGAKERIGFIAALCKAQRDFTNHEFWLLKTFTLQASMIIENALLYDKTQRMAMHDGLTNLYNHRRFREVLADLITEAKPTGKAFGLIMGDIDHFKNYNDTQGHLKGDVVLRTVGDILRSNVRGADTVARYGGEEFVILLPETELHGCSMVGENLRARIERHRFEGQNRQPGGALTITFGLAMFPADGQDAESLIGAADRALYAGKRLGRNRMITVAELPHLEEELASKPPAKPGKKKRKRRAGRKTRAG